MCRDQVAVTGNQIWEVFAIFSIVPVYDVRTVQIAMFCNT